MTILAVLEGLGDDTSRNECPHKSRKYRKCRCPIWAQEVLRGIQIRKSLDLVGWEAAQAKVREWESVGIEGTPISFAEAKGKYLTDVERRKLAPPAEKKYKLVIRQLSEFTTKRGILLLSDLGFAELPPSVLPIRRNSFFTSTPAAMPRHALQAIGRFVTQAAKSKPARILGTGHGMTPRPTKPVGRGERLLLITNNCVIGILTLCVLSF